MSVISLVEQFAAPPLGFMVTEPSGSNPLSGQNLMTRPRGIQTVDAFGVRWSMYSIPSGIGINSAAQKQFADRDVVFIGVYHLLLDATTVCSQFVQTNELSGYLRFEVAYPAAVVFEVYPGCTCDFSWLLVL